MVARYCIILTTASLLAGCWPARFTYQPGVKGSVVASDDGKPVSNAHIRVNIPRKDLVPVTSVASGPDGTFSVRPYYEWHIDSILSEPWPGEGSVEIVAPGFLAYRTNLRWEKKPGTQDLGVVRLERSQ